MSNQHNHIGDAEQGLVATIAALEAAQEVCDNPEEYTTLTVLIRTTTRLLKTVEGL